MPVFTLKRASARHCVCFWLCGCVRRRAVPPFLSFLRFWICFSRRCDVLSRLVGASVPASKTAPHRSADAEARGRHAQALRQQGVAAKSPTDHGEEDRKDKDAETDDGGDAGARGEAASIGAWGAAQGALLPFVLRRLVRERWNATYGPGSPSAIAATATVVAAVATEAAAEGDTINSKDRVGDGADREGLAACPLLPAPFTGQR